MGGGLQCLPCMLHRLRVADLRFLSYAIFVVQKETIVTFIRKRDSCIKSEIQEQQSETPMTALVPFTISKQVQRETVFRGQQRRKLTLLRGGCAGDNSRPMTQILLSKKTSISRHVSVLSTNMDHMIHRTQSKRKTIRNWFFK